MHHDPTLLAEKESVAQELFTSNVSSPNFDKKQNSLSSGESKYTPSARETNRKCEECRLLRGRIESLCSVDAVNVRRLEVLKDTVSQIDKERQSALVRSERLMMTIEQMRMQNLSLENELETVKSNSAAQANHWERQLLESEITHEATRLKAQRLSSAFLQLFEELEGSVRREIVLSEAAARSARLKLAKGVLSPSVGSQQADGVPMDNRQPVPHGGISPCALSGRLLASPRHSSSGPSVRHTSHVDACFSPRTSSTTRRSEAVHCKQSLLAEMASANEKLERELCAAREAQCALEEKVRLHELHHREDHQTMWLSHQLLVEQEARERLQKERDFANALLELSYQFRQSTGEQSSRYAEKKKPIGSGVLSPLPGLSPVAMRTSLKLQQGYNRRHVDPIIPQPFSQAETEGHSAPPLTDTKAPAVSMASLPDSGELHILDELSAYLTQVELDLSELETVVTKGETEAEQVRSLLETDVEKLLDSFISTESTCAMPQSELVHDRLSDIARSQKQTLSRLKSVSDAFQAQARSALGRDAVTAAATNSKNTRKSPTCKEPELNGLVRDVSMPGLSTERDSLSPEVAAPHQQTRKQVQFEMPHFVKKVPSLSGSQFGTATSCDEDLFNPGAISFPTLPSHDFEADDSDDERIPPVPTPKARVI